MSENIKVEFGRRFRAARDAKKMSRAALGIRLGISPKTIQSWEMGRTFIEKLSLIPSIEAELGISISAMIENATKGGEMMAAEAPAVYTGKAKKARLCAGPLPVTVNVVPEKVGKAFSAEELGNKLIAVPLLKPSAAHKDIPELTTKDVADYTVIPGAITPRCGVLVAFRMSDSSMVPMIPLDGTVIVDRRKVEIPQVFNKVVAIYIKGKGLRIRRLIKEHVSGKMYGMTALEGQRGRLPFRPEKGDFVIGKVIGVFAQPE